MARLRDSSSGTPPAAFRVLSTPEQIKMLAQPERLDLLRRLRDNPQSAAALADELGAPANRIHYHLNQLVEHGLAHEAGSRRDRGKEERLFRASAYHFLVDPGVGCHDPQTAAALNRAAEMIFVNWRREQILAIDHAQLASRIVNDSLAIKQGEHVIVMFGPQGMELSEAILVEIAAVGAHPHAKLWSRNLLFRTLDRHDAESLAALPFHDPEEDARTDAVILVSGNMPQGDPPTPEQQAKLGVRVEAVSRWQRSLRERNVRYLEVALPHLGEFEAGSLSPDEALDSYWHSVLVDQSILTNRAHRLLDHIGSNQTLNLSCNRGTDLQIQLDLQTPLVSDGVISANDLAAGRSFDSLPAGSVYMLPAGEQADGILHADYAFVAGRHFMDMRLTIESGRIVDLNAAENAQMLRQRVLDMPGDGDLIAGVQIGLNPAGHGPTGKSALDASLEGVVSVFFGNNELLGGDIHAAIDLLMPSFSMTGSFGDSIFVDQGRLVDEVTG